MYASSMRTAETKRVVVIVDFWGILSLSYTWYLSVIAFAQSDPHLVVYTDFFQAMEKEQKRWMDIAESGGQRSLFHALVLIFQW